MRRRLLLTTDAVRMVKHALRQFERQLETCDQVGDRDSLSGRDIIRLILDTRFLNDNGKRFSLRSFEISMVNQALRFYVHHLTFNIHDAVALDAPNAQIMKLYDMQQDAFILLSKFRSYTDDWP